MFTSREDFRKISECLGEPYPLETSAYAEKLRKTLMISSSIALIFLFYDVEIDGNSSFFGIKFLGIDTQIFFVIFFIVISYHFVHFLWCSINSFTYWRIRLTGTIVKYQVQSGLIGDEYDEADYPYDPKQASLYFWWSKTCEKVIDHQKVLDGLIPTLKKTLEEQPENTGQVLSEIRSIEESLNKTLEVVNSQRLRDSLKRFDNWFGLMLVTQGLRWLVLEVGLPLLVGLMTMILLILQIWFQCK